MICPKDCEVWMNEFTKETVVVVKPRGTIINPLIDSKTRVTNSQTLEYLVYFFLTVLEVLLAFRFVLKLLGASTASRFVSMIYALTNILIYPFEGIFSRALNQGLETTSVLEPATVMAMIVYSLLCGAVILLIRIVAKDERITV